MAVAKTGAPFRPPRSRRKKAGKKGLRPGGDAARYRALDLGRFKNRSKRRPGEVAEWSNVPHSKCGVPGRAPWVRIPPSPPPPNLINFKLAAQGRLIACHQGLRTQPADRSCCANTGPSLNRRTPRCPGAANIDSPADRLRPGAAHEPGRKTARDAGLFD